MAVIPSHARTNPAHAALGLKLSPSNSPYGRPSAPRSPSKARRNHGQEAYLSLSSIVGTTTASPRAFDCHPPTRRFVHVAGAAAVLVHVDEELHTTQRFFRARPTVVPWNGTPSVTSPSTPTPSNADLRTRTLTPLRDASMGGFGGGSPMGDWGDSPSSKTWTARERIKAATCVALSPDGRFLALGETGYNPRVMIFSTAPDALPDIPMAVIGHHTFGVAWVAWSCDSKYLATLGTNQDGFLHVFSINPRTGTAKLHASNKCTSFVHALVWMGRHTLVTAGTRHAKVWRVEDTRSTSPAKSRLLDGSLTPSAASPAPKSLAGRNCLLGPLLEATFTCAVGIGDNQAIACTQKGVICWIDDRDSTQRLSKVGHAGFPVTCIALDGDSQRVWLGGREGQLR
ncbi:MAG: hypothetical protein M1838_002380, partial [Thelocarpon superellum]